MMKQLHFFISTFQNFTFFHFFQLFMLSSKSIIDKLLNFKAAHCVYDPYQYIVIIGGHVNLDSQIYSYREIIMDKKNVFIYKTYNDDTLRDDIAMIKLPVAINKDNKNIGIVALPKNYKSNQFVGYDGTVVSTYRQGIN